MARQLQLIRSDEPVWRLDDETREVGRRGVAAARRALRRARPYRGGDHDPESRPTAA